MGIDRAALCGILAPLLFAVSLLVFAAIRADYSHLTDAVSELGARGAPNALAWNLVGFVGVGLLITVFAWGLYRGTASLAALVSVGLSGLGFAGTGVFPADMADLSAPSSRAHIVMSLISFAAFVPGAFVLCWRFLKLPRWAPVGIASGALALLAIASMPLREMDVPPGLAQRTTFVVYLVWIELLAVALWRRRTGFRAANGPH
ncbi:MAG TPA: DUF998 domain-containing protein [Gemmatimonadota bacterium]|nr:DUF998 domain-containing protein [Gemmatimonadota bacterium]